MKRRRSALTISRLRSAVSNGSTLLGSHIDHRSAPVRSLKALFAFHLSDLSGAQNLSQAEIQLCRRSAQMTLQLEMLEAKWALSNNGAASAQDLETYQRVTSSIRRVNESLGLQR